MTDDLIKAVAQAIAEFANHYKNTLWMYLLAEN